MSYGDEFNRVKPSFTDDVHRRRGLACVLFGVPPPLLRDALIAAITRATLTESPMECATYHATSESASVDFKEPLHLTVTSDCYLVVTSLPELLDWFRHQVYWLSSSASILFAASYFVLFKMTVGLKCLNTEPYR